MISCCQHDSNDDKADFLAFAESFLLLKVLLVIDISRGFVTGLDFNRNDLMLSDLTLKSFPVWSIDHFEVSSDFEILTFEEVAFESIEREEEE